MAAARAMAVDEGEAEEARQQREIWGDDRGHVGGGAYEVERLLARRLLNARWQYLVRYRGYGEKDDTWECERDIHAALVAEYDASHPRPAQQKASSGADSGEEDAEDAAYDPRLGCAAALGESRPRAVAELELPGTDQLQLDGRSRREVHLYKRKQAVPERQWQVIRVGGQHEGWGGRGEAWLAWARARFTFDEAGWLHQYVIPPQPSSM